MKKSLIYIGLFIFSIFATWAGPFGLSNGMTFEEVQQACGGNPPQRLADDDRYVITPVKSHPTFIRYIAWISEDYGLYYIKASSEDISSDNYGRELQNSFYNFVPRLEKTYGKAYVFDGLVDVKTIWHDDKYWFTALSDGARRLYASWFPNYGETVIKDDLVYISLEVSNSGYQKGRLYLDYEFINNELVESQEDDVL